MIDETFLTTDEVLGVPPGQPEDGLPADQSRQDSRRPRGTPVAVPQE